MIPNFTSNASLIRLNNRMRLLDAIRELFASSALEWKLSLSRSKESRNRFCARDDVHDHGEGGGGGGRAVPPRSVPSSLSLSLSVYDDAASYRGSSHRV